ncbi:RNA-directed DNA polymerase from mobile element jockey [Trachymyrmex zeteki]|uniref:RNA-directed DNA polymerase from mobile element jockey n=1 Tax=Mycetomoellerius zeteki TaxID=64791 RepID=A0A151WTU6_9HYME|nr:RNA-directed DNA polymerase from mobile element jockey [Trachymyrmex zeteki]
MNPQQPIRSHSYVPSQPLRITYWNCRGAYSKKPEIEKISEELDIIILAETCLSPDHAFSIRGFDCIRLDSTSNNIRGLLILIRNSILFSIVDIQFNFLPALEILAVKIHLKDSILNIVGAYRHPSIPMTNSIINSFYSFMSQFNSVLLIGDFNAHHPLWGSQRCNSAGTTLCDLTESLNLICLNPNASPTFLSHPTRAPSVIDLVFASTNLSSLCCVSVGNDLLGSDHFPIYVSLNSFVRSVDTFSHRTRLSPLQWQCVAAWLEEHAGDIARETSEAALSISPQEGYNTFIQGIMTCIDKNSPQKNSNRIKFFNGGGRSSRGLPPAPWWTPQCDEAIRERAALLKTYKRIPSIENYAAYQETVRTTRKVLRRAKRKGWQNFCKNLNHLTPSTQIWRMLKRFKNRRLISNCGKGTGQTSSQTTEIQDIVAKFCPPSCSTPIPPIPASTENRLSWLDSPFSINELRAALDSVKTASSPGMDRVEYRLLKVLPEELLSCLLSLLNLFFCSAIFPTQSFISSRNPMERDIDPFL